MIVVRRNDRYPFRITRTMFIGKWIGRDRAGPYGYPAVTVWYLGPIRVIHTY